MWQKFITKYARYLKVWQAVTAKCVRYDKVSRNTHTAIPRKRKLFLRRLPSISKVLSWISARLWFTKSGLIWKSYNTHGGVVPNCAKHHIYAINTLSRPIFLWRYTNQQSSRTYVKHEHNCFLKCSCWYIYINFKSQQKKLQQKFKR